MRTTVVVVDSYQGKRLNGPNDVTSDARGRIYFTDARYFGDEPIELPSAIYRVDSDGRVERLSTDIYRPNGIEVSPDGRSLYVSASNLKERLARNPAGPLEDRFGLTLGGVVAYDLDRSGNVGNGRVFYRRDDSSPMVWRWMRAGISMSPPTIRTASRQEARSSFSIRRERLWQRGERLKVCVLPTSDSAEARTHRRCM